MTYLSLPLRVASRFEDANDIKEDIAEYHMWHDADLAFAGYAHTFWPSHVRGVLDAWNSSSQPVLVDMISVLHPWYQKMLTCVRLPSPWNTASREVLENGLLCDQALVPLSVIRLNVEP